MIASVRSVSVAIKQVSDSQGLARVRKEDPYLFKAEGCQLTRQVLAFALTERAGTSQEMK